MLALCLLPPIKFLPESRSKYGSDVKPKIFKWARLAIEIVRVILAQTDKSTKHILSEKQIQKEVKTHTVHTGIIVHQKV
jgi:hypothetical protein